MRNKKNTNARSRQSLDYFQKLLCFAFSQYGGRFIKDQQLQTLFVNLPGYLHKLQIADGQTLNSYPFLDIHAQLIQGSPGISGHLLAI